jgi:ATP/ADP translocase
MVTAGGAEVLPFLASCCVLPASVAFFVLYGKLVRASLVGCIKVFRRSSKSYWQLHVICHCIGSSRQQQM